MPPVIPRQVPRRPVAVRRRNWWAIAAFVVLAAYALLVLVVILLWAQVGFFFPGVDYPHPTAAESLPAVAAGITAIGSVPAILAGVVLAIVGLIRRGVSRPPAIVALVLAGVAFPFACFAAIVEAGLVFFAA